MPIDWSCVFFFFSSSSGVPRVTGLIGEMSLREATPVVSFFFLSFFFFFSSFFFPVHWVVRRRRRRRRPLVSWRLSSRCRVNGHESRMWARSVKVKWRRETKKESVAKKRLHIPELLFRPCATGFKLIRLLYLLSLYRPPSCTKNTVACLTLARCRSTAAF